MSPKQDDSVPIAAADVVVVSPSTVAVAMTDTGNQGNAMVLSVWEWTVFLGLLETDKTSSGHAAAAAEAVVAEKSKLSSPPCSSEPWNVFVEHPSRQ